MPAKKDIDGYFRHQETYEGVKIDLTAKSESTLTEKVRQRKNAIDAGEALESKNITLRTWCDEWLEAYKKDNVSEPYYLAVKSHLVKYVYPEIGTVPLKSIRPIHIQKLLNGYQGMSKSSVSKIRGALSEAMKQAVIEKYITVNPVTGTSVPKKTTSGTHRALTDTERAVLLQVCETHYAGVWIKVLLYCGLRPQETVPLTWKDVDMVKRCIHVRQALKASGEVGKPKSASGVRDVPIPDILYTDLQKVERGADDALVFTTQHIKNTDNGGNMYDHKRMKVRWNNIKRHMKILMGIERDGNKLIEDKNNPFLPKSLQLYCLRHTYCTDLFRAGVSMNTAKYLMGHADITMVDRIYGHHTNDESSDALEKINQLHAETVTSVGTKK